MDFQRVNTRLTEQLQHVQKELARNLAEADSLGDALIALGSRLKIDPWKWSVDWVENAFPEGEWTEQIEPEVLAALDSHRIARLLDDIHVLRRREAQLKRLSAS